MSEPNTLQVVLMGLITVFVVLICLIGIIKLMGLVMVKLAERKAVPAVQTAAPAAAPVPVGQTASADKQKLVAAVAAAIAEDMGTDVDHLKIHSIRRL